MSIEIYDIDGTLTTTGDTPNQAMVDHLRLAAAEGSKIVIVSARPISRLDETRAWLNDHQIPADELHLNDFEGAGQGPNVGLAFKEYKYKLLVEQYGLEEIEYAVDNDADVRAMARGLGIEAYSPEELLASEERAIYAVPDYMRAAARAGLDYYEQGLAGDGLQPETVREARQIAEGRIDSDKIRRMAAWIRRHRGDWEGVPANSDPSNPDYPQPGAVAGLLWAVDVTAADGADRVLRWADDIVQSEDDVAQSDNGSDELPLDRSIEEMAKNYETRALPVGDFNLAADDSGQRTFTGYAALWDTPSAGLPFTEVIKPGAFKRSLSRAAKGQKVIAFLFGHDEMRALATTASGRLNLTEDERGLRVEAKLDPKDPDAAKVISMLTNEPQSAGMSFAFYANKDAWDGETRQILEANITEASILSVGQTPAYPATLGLAAVRKIAKDRIGVDPDALITTLESVKAGNELTDAEVEVIDTVRERLAPKREGIDPTIAAARVLLERLRNDAI